MQNVNHFGWQYICILQLFLYLRYGWYILCLPSAWLARRCRRICMALSLSVHVTRKEMKALSLMISKTLKLLIANHMIIIHTKNTKLLLVGQIGI
jgi:hypothetical protein